MYPYRIASRDREDVFENYYVYEITDPTKVSLQSERPQPERPTTLPGNVRPQPERPTTLPGDIRPQPERPTTLPGNVRPQPERPTTLPENVRPQPERPTTLPGDIRPQPGRPNRPGPNRPNPAPRPPAGGGQRPTAPPPQRIPARGPAPRAIDSGAIRGCMYSFTYVWLRNGQEFWFFPTYLGARSIAGFRWDGYRWAYIGFDLNTIDFFSCV